MYIPPEFSDYLVTKSHLGLADQDERFVKMHLDEIRDRAVILRNLDYDKETTKKRIKKYIEWGFEFFDTPRFYQSVDSIVDDVYNKKKMD